MPESISARSAANPTLLVIDDEIGLRDMLSRFFSRRGWRVRTAGSGEEGVAASREEAFDVILCDVMMPGMDGLAVLETLKRERPLTEVVLVTGYPTDEGAKLAAKLGAYGYISKPCDLLSLEAVLDEARDLKR